MEKNKMKFNYFMRSNYTIDNFEKRFLRWTIDNRHKIVLLLIATVIFGNISRLPYLNLIFTKDISSLIIIVFSLIIFKIRIKSIFIIGILLFLPTFLLELIGKMEMAEFIANCVYTIFAVGVVKGVAELKKD